MKFLGFSDANTPVYQPGKHGCGYDTLYQQPSFAGYSAYLHVHIYQRGKAVKVQKNLSYLARLMKGKQVNNV